MAVHKRAFGSVTGRTPAPSVQPHVLLSIITFVLVVAALWSAQVLLIPLVFAALAVCGLEPLHRRLVKWHVPRALSAALIVISVVAALAGSGWGLRKQTTAFMNQLPVLTQRLRDAIRDGQGGFGSTVQPVQQAANDL